MEKKRYISWSGGKDSTATVIISHELGIHIDLIVISLPFFDKEKGIYADYPSHIKFIFEKAIPLFQSWGYKVKVVSSEKDYKYWFFKRRKDGSNKYYGWILGGMCKMNGEKVNPIKKLERTLLKEGWESIVGIGVDEEERLIRMKKRKGQISLLEHYCITTQMAFELCKKYDLLSPIYENGRKRQGCFFCPNASIKEFANLQGNYPQLWEELLQLNKYYQEDPAQFVSKGFKYGITFDQIIKQVELINNQIDFFDLIDKYS